MLSNAMVRTLAGVILAFAVLSMSSLPLQAQGTGTIKGKIIDKKTKEPLGFANIVIVGTTKGAMSLDSGDFTINGVPAGTYQVKAMMMGYKAVEKIAHDDRAGQQGAVPLTVSRTEAASTGRTSSSR